MGVWGVGWWGPKSTCFEFCLLGTNSIRGEAGAAIEEKITLI